MIWRGSLIPRPGWLGGLLTRAPIMAGSDEFL